MNSVFWKHFEIIESVNKFQNTVSKLEKQLKDEKTTNKAKLLRIVVLESKVFERGLDPLQPALVHNILREKDKQIQALKKIISILAYEHVKMLELMATQEEK